MFRSPPPTGGLSRGCSCYQNSSGRFTTYNRVDSRYRMPPSPVPAHSGDSQSLATDPSILISYKKLSLYPYRQDQWHQRPISFAPLPLGWLVQPPTMAGQPYQSTDPSAPQAGAQIPTTCQGNRRKRDAAGAGLPQPVQVHRRPKPMRPAARPLSPYQSRKTTRIGRHQDFRRLLEIQIRFGTALGRYARHLFEPE